MMFMCSLLSGNGSLQPVSTHCTEIAQTEVQKGQSTVQYVCSLRTRKIRHRLKYAAFIKEQHLKTDHQNLTFDRLIFLKVTDHINVVFLMYKNCTRIK